MQTAHPLRHYSTLQCRDTGHWERVMEVQRRKGGRKEEREGRKEGRRDRGRGREGVREGVREGGGSEES